MVDNQLKTGEIFEGKYKILGELGRGGSGVVYLAYQKSMDRKVALKVLTPSKEEKDAGAVQRFHREVKIISKLQHPNTITIHEFGERPNGVLYMVLEHVNGEELKTLIKREGPQNVVRAVHFAKQIAKALSEAHDHAVIHRDLKPANIMLTKFGADQDFIKVLDFGVASLLDPNTQDLTGFNPVGEKNIVGTPRYMSPEQVHGETLTSASDIYNLGLILYEMLCGYPAVSGKSTMALISQQISEKPLSLPGLDALHPEIQEIIRIATSKKPSDRFQTAVQMHDALEAFIFKQNGRSEIQNSKLPASQEVTVVGLATPSVPMQKSEKTPTRPVSLATQSKYDKSEFLEKGTLVGSKYEIIKPIARGGFSVVYLAKFANTDSPLAIKILDKNEQLDPVWVARFRREASLIRGFSHPNTVRILDFGEQTDFHYIAMEFVPGRSLFKQIRKHGALEARQIAEIIVLVCGAILEAHNKGVLHRDLKPSNIMLTETADGFSAKVLDFGSAKLVDLHPGQSVDKTSQGYAFQKLTQQGVFVGTPRYAAPEQLLQEDIDIRVDIYGLGMVMWEALVGDPAVSKLDYASCIELHLGPAPWMLPLSVNTPPEFANIVHRALQKKKEDRYQNVEELASDLRKFLETLDSESDFQLSISEVSDPFYEDAIFGDITGLENDSDVPLLDPEPRVKTASRPKVQYKKAKREAPPVIRQKSISEVEELELETVKRLPKRDLPLQHHDPNRKKKNFLLPYLIALAVLGGFVYLVLKESEDIKDNMLVQIQTPDEVAATLNHEFIISALRSTGWILRQGEPLPYRDGVELRTLIADKKGLKTTISVFECTNSKQVKELQKLSDTDTDSIAFGSTFIRWKNTDSGATMLSRTLFELKKIQQK